MHVFQEMHYDSDNQSKLASYITRLISKDFENPVILVNFAWEKLEWKYTTCEGNIFSLDKGKPNPNRYLFKHFMLPFFEINLILTQRKSSTDYISTFFKELYNWGMDRIRKLGIDISELEFQKIQILPWKIQELLLVWHLTSKELCQYFTDRQCNLKKVFRYYIHLLFALQQTMPRFYQYNHQLSQLKNDRRFSASFISIYRIHVLVSNNNRQSARS